MEVATLARVGARDVCSVAVGNIVIVGCTTFVVNTSCTGHSRFAATLPCCCNLHATHPVKQYAAALASNTGTSVGLTFTCCDGMYVNCDVTVLSLFACSCYPNTPRYGRCVVEPTNVHSFSKRGCRD